MAEHGAFFQHKPESEEIFSYFLFCRLGNCNHCRGNLHCARACQLDVLVLLLRVLLLPVIGRGRKSLAMAQIALVLGREAG